MSKDVWLIGAGYMAREFAKVLKGLDADFITIGRGVASAAEFKKQTGMEIVEGGVEQLLEQGEKPNKVAIVSVGVEQLAPVTIHLLNNGIKKILVEKPGGMTRDEIKKVAETAGEQNAEVYVAYNRRYYSSVQAAKKIILEDGGVLSFCFDFTEVTFEIETMEKAPGIKENWLLANSTHIIDLAMYLGGKFSEIKPYVSGAMSWHPSGAVFCGAGKAETGALFSYHADWAGPGRWSVEVITKKHKLILRPVEKLQIQPYGTMKVDFADIDDDIDQQYKPGVYLETKEFLEGVPKELPTIAEQYEYAGLCDIINGK